MAAAKPAAPGRSPYVRWARRRRPLLTALVVGGILGYSILARTPPADVLDPTAGWRFWTPWALMLLGTAIRLWGAGNLRKNQELTTTGVYVLVRHPLYLGTLCVLLAFFISVGDPLVGLIGFGLLVGLVYYPTMLSEEDHLESKFASQFRAYRPPPRLIPDLTRLPEALRTDRFQFRDAYGNLGFRVVWFFAALPLVVILVSFLQRSLR